MMWILAGQKEFMQHDSNLTLYLLFPRNVYLMYSAILCLNKPDPFNGHIFTHQNKTKNISRKELNSHFFVQYNMCPVNNTELPEKGERQFGVVIPLIFLGRIPSK